MNKLQNRETDTVGSWPFASEVQCLFWSYLKAATKKEAGISQPSLPPFLTSPLPLLSPSHTPTGDSRQCRAHWIEGTRTTLKTASAQQQTQQARESVCRVFNYACCAALHSPASQGNCTVFAISAQVFCWVPWWPCNLTSLDMYSTIARVAGALFKKYLPYTRLILSHNCHYFLSLCGNFY